MSGEGMQATRPATGGDAPARDLNRFAREAAGLGVLFGEAVAARLGITHTDLECLDMILLRGRVTAGEIAAASGLTTGAATGVIDRLERAGLVRRERDAADRRKVHVTAEPAAHKAAATYYGPFEAEMKRLAEAYTEEQRSLLVDFFARSAAILRAEIGRLAAGTEHGGGSRRPIAAGPDRTRPKEAPAAPSDGEIAATQGGGGPPGRTGSSRRAV